MRRRYRALLILGFLLLSGGALAQGLGLGLGFEDMHGGHHATAATHVWIWNTNGHILWNTNGNVLCNAC